jgi:hypothetical protein
MQAKHTGIHDRDGTESKSKRRGRMHTPCVGTDTHTRTHVHTHAHTHAHTHTRACVRTHIRTHTHTCTHTYAQARRWIVKSVAYATWHSPTHSHTNFPSQKIAHQSWGKSGISRKTCSTARTVRKTCTVKSVPLEFCSLFLARTTWTLRSLAFTSSATRSPGLSLPMQPVLPSIQVRDR